MELPKGDIVVAFAKYPKENKGSSGAQWPMVLEKAQAKAFGD